MMMRNKCIHAIICLVLLSGTTIQGYPTYIVRIPNGYRVPVPCFPSIPWLGVGHYFKLGAGPLNSFGVDFYLADHVWTVELCQKDSDGDGKTNGEELGDPNCVWKQGDTPSTSEGLSHPGLDESSLPC